MLKKIFELSCKQATFLASKKEAGKTSFFENLKLKLHYKICTGCKLFDEQTTLIGKNAKHTHKYTDSEMSAEKKQKIKELMETMKIVILIICC